MELILATASRRSMSNEVEESIGMVGNPREIAAPFGGKTMCKLTQRKTPGAGIRKALGQTPCRCIVVVRLPRWGCATRPVHQVERHRGSDGFTSPSRREPSEAALLPEAGEHGSASSGQRSKAADGREATGGVSRDYSLKSSSSFTLQVLGERRRLTQSSPSAKNGHLTCSARKAALHCGKSWN